MNLQSMPQMAAKLFKPRVAQAMLAALLMSTCGTAMAQDYQFSTDTLGFTSIRDMASGGTGTGTDQTANFSGTDTGHFDIAVPFDLEFFGQSFTTTDMLRVYTDGFMAFNNTSGSSFSPVNLTSSSARNDAIYLFWDDTDLAKGGAVYTETQGTAPNRVWIIEYSMVAPFSSTGTQVFDGQVAIFETTNVVELRYSASTVTAGGSVAIGLKNFDGTVVKGTPGTATTTSTPTENYVFTPAVPTVDLTVTGLTLSASGPFQPGDMVTVDFTLENSSTVDSTAFDAGIYLSDDAVIDSNDQLISTVMAVTLTAGATSVESEMITIPTPNPAGSNGRRYFIGVLADNAMTQTENDTANNAAAASALIGPAPYVVVPVQQSSFSSIVKPTVQSGVTILADNNLPGDTGELATTLPFDFRYFGTMIPAGSPVAVSYDGYIELNDSNISTGSGFNGTLPRTSTSSPVNNPIFVFWDDLELEDISTSVIAERTVGTAPNRQWIIEYNGVSDFNSSSTSFSMDISFQVILEETTNTIRFNYDPNQSDTRSSLLNATIGLQTTGGTDFVEVLPGSSNLRPTNNFAIIENGNSSAMVDLTVNSVSVAQTAANAGSAIDVTVDIANSGAAASGTFSYIVLISDDATIDLTDQVIGTGSTAGVGAGSNMMETISVSVPTSLATGPYSVGVIVNSGTSPIGETDLSNNTGVTAMTFQVDPPGRDEGDLNDDDAVNIADVMFCINFALNDDTNVMGDLNGDNSVNVLDIQLSINRVLNAP